MQSLKRQLLVMLEWDFYGWDVAETIIAESKEKGLPTGAPFVHY